MRPGAEFPTTSHAAPVAAPGAVNGTAPHSPWQSPVPYLFGGLAAMLGLIAVALLILACSYWKLSGYPDAGRGQRASGEAAGGGDGEKGAAAGAARPAPGVREHVVVIMAGEARPTFLATPAASRASVAELGAAPGSGKEEKEKEREHVHVDGGGCEREGPRLLGADGGGCEREGPRLGTVSRSGEGSTGSASAAALAE